MVRPSPDPHESIYAFMAYYLRFLRVQHNATQHCIFSSNLVPIPLQTEDYARGLLEAGRAAGLIEDVEVAVALRMDLQAAILDGRPDLWVLIDEIALRPMGNAQVMADQRERLAEMGKLHHVSVRILPLSAAPHTGVDGSYWCFTLPGRRLAAHSGNALGMGRVIDDQTEAAEVARRFQRLAARAWNEDQSRQYLSRMGETDDGLAQE